jgi:uncharacterized membrane protein
MQNPTQLNFSNAERGASLIAGSLMLYTGVRNRTLPGWGLALAGAALLGHGMKGRRSFWPVRNGFASVPYRQGVRIDCTVTVNKPRFEVYTFWRNLENLPAFMRHLEKVRTVSDTVSHWVTRGAFDRLVEWDAQVITDAPGEMISWRSLPGSGIDNAGSVHFRDAAGDRGTVVRVALQYLPPGGPFGTLAARLFGTDPQKQVGEDLRRFKTILETGEIPATLHAYHKSEEKKAEQRSKEANVVEASEGSFPASDAPGWA